MSDCIFSVLASLNLPAALEDLSGAKVPQSVKDKAKQIQELGGVARIDSLISGLPDLLTRNREILDEVGGYALFSTTKSCDLSKGSNM